MYTTSLRSLLLATVALGVLSGCSLFEANVKESEKTPLQQLVSGKSSETKIATRTETAISPEKKTRFDGGLLLGNTDTVAYQPHELASTLDGMIAADKWNSARNLIGLYPDVVSKILLGQDGASISRQRLRDVAKLFDEKWTRDGSGEWQALVRLSGRTESINDFLTSRSLFLELIGNNEPKDALAMNLSKNLDKTASSVDLVAAEALRLEGIAYLMMEKYSDSIKRFDQAFSLLKPNHPYQASKIGLLLGETQRHAKNHDQWKSTWQASTDIQSRWLHERNLVDPAFWEKAAFLRPVSSEWSERTISRLENSLRNESLDFGSDQSGNNEAVIWATIGIQRLKRHEAQNAILAFKKSEALISDKVLKSELQMQQALAMIDAGQPGPASAILLRLSSTNSASHIGDRAKAILATLKLQNGSLAQGMNLLQSAMPTCQQWPESERLRAQADYGLSYLMLGKESEGISLLDHVYEQFMKRDEYDQASQCLWNIATYYEKTQQPRKLRVAKAKLKQMESL
ncbi:hypothetical protein [Mariniblastus fucicola]|uniref:hypothetical protein n=1 Tax=Mariniblastus fucicola TaxID=980251 RepID=UPI0011E037AB|nr:hypothetical protein [Mariniblastus fucicola]